MAFSSPSELFLHCDHNGNGISPTTISPFHFPSEITDNLFLVSICFPLSYLSLWSPFFYSDHQQQHFCQIYNAWFFGGQFLKFVDKFWQFDNHNMGTLVNMRPFQTIDSCLMPIILTWQWRVILESICNSYSVYFRYICFLLILSWPWSFSHL